MGALKLLNSMSTIVCSCIVMETKNLFSKRSVNQRRKEGEENRRETKKENKGRFFFKTMLSKIPDF